MKTKFFSGGWSTIIAILAAFILMMTGCKSGAEDKPEEDAGPPARSGVVTIMENPAHLDGVYDLGQGISIQFLGETWIQSKEGTPVAGGSFKGAPPAPVNEDGSPITSLDDLDLFFSKIEERIGVLNLAASHIYAADKWWSTAQVDKLLSNPLAAKGVPESVKSAYGEFKNGIKLNYKIVDEAPYIELSKA